MKKYNTYSPKVCTTHHFACPCREFKFQELERENAALRKSIERHGQANDKLVMENAALRADKERLDWVDQHGSWLTFRPNSPEGTWRCKAELTFERAGYGENARVAIDAARKERFS